MRFVCPKCQLELRPKKTGIAVESMTDFGSYQIWAADLWHCPGCELEIVAGFGSVGQRPIAEYWQPDYEDQCDIYKSAVRFWANRQERERYEKEHSHEQQSR